MFIRAFQRKILTKKINYSFFQTKLTHEKMVELNQQFIRNPTLKVYESYITNNSDYFKVFSAFQQLPFQLKAFLELKEKVNKIPEKSDNLFLLRSKIEAIIAGAKAKEGKVEEAIQYYQNALQILQSTHVPQLLPYYQIYRKYGLFLCQIQSKRNQACEILQQSVQILKQFVSQSEDPVATEHNSIEQARSCVKLMKLQESQRQKWLSWANQYWSEVQEQKYELEQYAETVYENALERKKQSEKKAMIYAEVEIQKISIEKYHEMIRRALQ